MLYTQLLTPMSNSVMILTIPSELALVSFREIKLNLEAAQRKEELVEL